MKACQALLIFSLLIPNAFLIELNVQNTCSFPIWLATTPNFGQESLPGDNAKVDPGQRHIFQVS